MMWNWLVATLAVGATIVLYDGSPFRSCAGRMWFLVDELGYTFLLMVFAEFHKCNRIGNVC